MSSNKKNLDDLFKNRLLNEQAGFNPAHWDKMAGLLDKQFVKPSISTGAASISTAAKLLIICVSISVPAFLFIYFGTDLLKKDNIIIEKSFVNKLETNENDSALYIKESILSKNENSNTYSDKKDLKNTEILTNNKKVNPNNLYVTSNIQSEKKIINHKKTNQTSDKNEKIFETNQILNNQENDKLITNQQFEQIEKLNEIVLDKKLIIDNNKIDTNTKLSVMKTPENIVKEDSLFLPENENSFFPLQKYHGIYAYLGINYGISFSNVMGNNMSNYLSPVFGIGFEKSLKKDKFALLIELLYLKSYNHSFEKNSISKSYFLDEETIITNLNTYELEYLRLPIIFNYQLNKHHFITGIYASYLLNSKSILTQKIISQNVNQSNTSVVNGYRDGFDDFSFGIIIGYNYSLSKMFNLGIRFNYSPADLSKNSYYINSKNDHLTELQFNIMWKLY